MLEYKANWEQTMNRFTAYWSRENDTALMAVTCLKDGAQVQSASFPETAEERKRYFTDPELLHQRHVQKMENTFLGGDALPVLWTNFGTAGHAKYFRGCRFSFTRDTVWYEPSMQENDLPEFAENGGVLEEEKACIQTLCALAEGRYIVSVPDNCGDIDALAHLRGSDMLLMDMAENPEWVTRCLQIIQDGYQHAHKALFALLRENNSGGISHGWMQLWAPGTLQQLQADLSVMISAKMFEDLLLPNLQETCRHLDYSIYHLDGQEQIRHLDMLLEIPELNAIQWTPVTGQPKTSHFIPVLQRIQRAGKGLMLFPDAWEVPALLEALDPRGLHMVVHGVKNEAQARDLLCLRDRFCVKG